MEIKPIWKSKTFWFNVLALLVLVANAFGFVDFQPSQDVDNIALVIITIANLVLRMSTTQSVKFKK